MFTSSAVPPCLFRMRTRGSRYWFIGASSAIRPLSTSCSTRVVVKSFEIDAARNRVSGVARSPRSRSAKPNPSAKRMPSRSKAATAVPVTSALRRSPSMNASSSGETAETPGVGSPVTVVIGGHLREIDRLGGPYSSWRLTTAGRALRALAGHVDEVTELVALALEVAPVVRVGRGHDGDALDDFEAVALEASALGGVVRDQPNLVQVEVGEDLHTDAVVAAVGGEAERFVRLDGIEAVLLLELVGTHLVAEADATALLPHVDEDAAALGSDLLEREVYLLAAVAAHRVEDVAGDALGVDADEDGLGRRDVAADEGGVLVRVDGGAVRVEREVAPLRRQDGGGDALDEPLALGAMADELGDADDLQVMASRELLQLGQAHHRSVRVHQLADGGDGIEPAEAAEVDGSLGLSGAHEDAALAGAQGVDVAGHHEVVRLGIGAGEHLDGLRAVGGRDAGGNAF